MKTFVFFVVALMFLNINLFAQAVPVADGFQLPLDNYNVNDNCLEWGGWGAGPYEGQRHLADDECSPFGTEVFSSANGIVRFARSHGSCPNNWGPLIVIESRINNSNVCVIYGHVVNDPLINEGGIVTRGQKIGEIADGTGCWSDHIHFSIYQGGYGMPNGEYPNWLHGYLFPSTWPGNYVDPIWYVNNNSPSSSPVGCFSANDCSGPVSLAFQQKYNAMAASGHPLGNPWDNGGSAYVHEVNGMYIQDFQDLRDQGGPSNGYYHPYTALIYDATAVSTANVRLLKEGFWDTWMNNTGWVNFGSPITDEYSNSGEIWQTFRRYGLNYPSNQSDYENFYFTWNSSTQLLEVLDKNYNPVDLSQLTVTTADVFTRAFKSSSLNESTLNESKQYDKLDYSLNDSLGGGSRLVSDTKISIAKVMSITTEPDGVYHSGLAVSNLGQPFPLVNQRDYDNFYAVINGIVIPIDPFTMNGDMTIYVDGSPPEADIQFSHWTIYPNPGTVGQQIHVEGQIYNQGSSTVTLSEVRVEFLAPNGVEIYHWSEYNVTLDPGYYWYQWLYCYPYISGNHTARFRGLINGQWQTYATQTVYVQNDPNDPVADFTGSPLSGSAPLTVQFTDLSTNNPNRWQWLFGDGSVLHDVQNPQHTFVNPGVYTVDLLVYNDFGGDRIIKNSFVTVYESVVANFISDVTSGSAPLTVQFTDQSSGSPTSWYWDFGDGNVSYDQNPSHIYFIAGTYPVSLTVSNNNQSDSVMKNDYITVTDTNVVDCVADYLRIYGTTQDVAVSGNYAYVVHAAPGGFKIIDISNPHDAIFVGEIDFSTMPSGVVILGDYAYVSDLYGGLFIINISNPNDPFVCATLEMPGLARGIAVSGNYAYLAEGRNMQVVDISDPYSPMIVASVASSYTTVGVVIWGDYAYLMAQVPGVQVVDISDPTSPVTVCTVNTPGAAEYIVFDGNYAYVADNAEGMCVLDVSNPALPVVVTSIDTDHLARGITKAGNIIYLANYQADVQIIDVTDPTTPMLIGNYETPGYAMRTAVNDNYLFIADGYSSGLIIRHLGCGFSNNQTVSSKDGFEEYETTPNLLPNYPNPFNPVTTISYSLPTSQHVSLVVYNILGQTVTTLVDGMKEAGEHSAIWDGRNDHGSSVSSGMYFYRLTTVEASFVRKMILLK